MKTGLFCVAAAVAIAPAARVWQHVTGNQLVVPVAFKAIFSHAF